MAEEAKTLSELRDEAQEGLQPRCRKCNCAHFVHEDGVKVCRHCKTKAVNIEKGETQ